MKIDLFHNIILKDALSASFADSVARNLVPLVRELVGDDIICIQMYEDYLGDNLLSGGYWFYPLTVVTGTVNSATVKTVWIRWNVSSSADFPSGAPYTYLGDNLVFESAPTVPPEFEACLDGRGRYFEDNYIKLNVTTTAPAVSFLSGRFSQTFIDEMARQITGAVSSVCGVEGLGESSIELDMVFAPESYMEHTSENVTYRRLLMSAKGCAPRDFWVKWRRRAGEGAYSCVDNVSYSDIEFSLGEDVPHKVREKEYRYLVRGNSNKYQTAMGKKNITEWRDLIKRSVKRGELTKIMTDSDFSSHSGEIADKVSEILERFNMSVPGASAADEYKEERFDDIAGMAKAKLENYSMASAPMTQLAAAEDVTDSDEFSFTVPDFSALAEEFGVDVSDKQEASLDTEAPTVHDEAVFADNSEIHFEEPAGRVSSDELDKLRLELDRALLMQLEAEEKLAHARDERDSALGALTALKAELSAKLSDRDAALAEARAEIEGLRAKIELDEKERAREKELFVESARRIAEEERAKLREREEALLRRERAAAEAERVKIDSENAERAAEAHRAELARIEAEIAAREEERRFAKERRDEERRERERAALEGLRRMGLAEGGTPRAEAVVDTEEPDSPDENDISDAEELDNAPKAPITPDNHPYTSVSAKLIFRHNVDKRGIAIKLEEIIKRGLSRFNMGHVYIKLKATIPEPNVVLLDFEQFPDGENKLLSNIINLIGHSDIGVIKVIVE